MYYMKGNRERIRPPKSEGDRLCITGKETGGSRGLLELR